MWTLTLVFWLQGGVIELPDIASYETRHACIEDARAKMHTWEGLIPGLGSTDFRNARFKCTTTMIRS